MTTSAEQDAHQELLDAEKRWLEDELHAQRHQNELLHKRLASCHAENTSLRRDLSDGAAGAGPSEPDSGADHAPAANRDSAPVPPTLDEIEIDLGTPTADAASYESPVDRLQDDRVASIVLNRMLTGGADLDNKPGDDALAVVIEPRNAAGKYVPLSAPVSIKVTDPQGRAPVAQWDFTANETRILLMKSSAGQGIHLLMPWPNEPPQAKKLKVAVQYTTPDGRKLDASLEFTLDQASDLSARWTPSALEAFEQFEMANHEAKAESTKPPTERRTTMIRGADTGSARTSERPRPKWSPFR